MKENLIENEILNNDGILKNLAWELFQRTGMIGYYNLFNELEKEN